MPGDHLRVQMRGQYGVAAAGYNAIEELGLRSIIRGLRRFFWAVARWRKDKVEARQQSAEPRH
jgi:hypothetical protein